MISARLSACRQAQKEVYLFFFFAFLFFAILAIRAALHGFSANGKRFLNQCWIARLINHTDFKYASLKAILIYEFIRIYE